MPSATVHYFKSSREAYDACNYSERVEDGDILVIEAEQVIGLAWAWPVAVTQKVGAFHTVEGGDPAAIEGHKGQVFSDAIIAKAKALVQEKGWW